MTSMVSRFEESERELLEIPHDEVERGLDEAMHSSTLELWRVFEDPDTSRADRDRAELIYGLSAVAKYDHEGPQDIEARTLVPGWLLTAQTELKSFMDENPDSRHALSRTPFLSQDLGTLMNLNRSVYSSVFEQGGSYDSRAFAAAVATNRVVVRSSPEPETPAVSHSRRLKNFSLRGLGLVRRFVR